MSAQPPGPFLIVFVFCAMLRSRMRDNIRDPQCIAFMETTVIRYRWHSLSLVVFKQLNYCVPI